MIYGFGKWIDYSIDFSKEKFICIYGENESGKSTLQNFILFMLFGLPPKQREFYRPKTSGKMGGRLTITDPVVGEYTIERLDEVQNGAARCFTVDGQEYGEEWLNDRLKGMTREIYQSVYSFSALDLNDFKQMKDEDIGEILLGIGLTGSNNIYKIEKQLDQKIGELFKPTGKIPIINQQLDSLEELFSQLMNDKNNEATYQDKQEQVDMIHTEIDHLQIKLKEAKEAKQTIERYQYHLPMINDYHLYINQLENYPNQIKFPEDGLERLNILKEKLLPLQSEQSVLHANRMKLETEQANLQEKQLDKDIYEEAQKVLLGKTNFDEKKRERGNIQEKVTTLKIKLDTALAELNIGLTSDQLAHVSLPFYLEEKWNQLRKETDRLHFENEQLQQEQSGLEKQRVFLSNQIAEIKENLLTTTQLEELYARLDAYKESAYRNKLKEETSEKQKKWKSEKVLKEKRILSLLIGSMVIGLLAGGMGFLLDYSILYNLMVIIIILGIGQWGLGKKGIKETNHLLANHENVQELSINISESQKQAADQKLIEYDENRSTLSSFENQLKSIDVQLIQLNEKSHGLEQRKAKLRTQIEEQLEHYPFLDHIEINYWHEFYHTMKQLLGMLQEKQTYQQQIEKINKEIKSYTDIITHFLKTIDQSLINHSISFQTEMMENIARKYEQSEQKKERINKELIENMSQQEEIKHKMNVYEQEVLKLFNIAQVGSEDEFYKNEKQRLEKKEIEEKIQRTSEQLQAAFSRATWRDISQNKPDQSKLEVEDQQTGEEIQEIEESIHVKRQQLADLHADLAKMESSEKYSQTMHQYMMEKAELAKLAKEWAVLKSAKEMLVETKRKYRDKYLIDVIARTSVYFQKITLNTYENIIPPQAGKPFQVETVDQMRYQLNELSQGTIDQLYVCLRLAISEIMSEEHHLPFIIDDAFVHFDARRTKQMTEILTTIGEKQQIILFTCKQEVANSVSDSHIIELKNTIQIN